MCGGASGSKVASTSTSVSKSRRYPPLRRLRLRPTLISLALAMPSCHSATCSARICALRTAWSCSAVVSAASASVPAVTPTACIWSLT